MNLSDSSTSSWQGAVVAVPFVLMAIVICLVIVFGASGRSPRSLAGGLRGNRIFIVQVSNQHEQSEQIEVYTDQSATRAFYPLPQPTAYSKISLSAELWTELNTLRQQWCERPPQFPHNTEQSAGYDIAVQCGRVLNPVIRVPVEALPRVFRTLLEIVPPPPMGEDT